MGFNHSSSLSFNASQVAPPVTKTDLFGAVLAGFGIWTKPSPVAKPKPQAVTQPTLNNVYPLRVVRVKEVSPQTNPQMAGRMVISGRMADVCAELDKISGLTGH